MKSRWYYTSQMYKVALMGFIFRELQLWNKCILNHKLVWFWYAICYHNLLVVMFSDKTFITACFWGNLQCFSGKFWCGEPQQGVKLCFIKDSGTKSMNNTCNWIFFSLYLCLKWVNNLSISARSVASNQLNFVSFFSSPEPKAQVSYCHSAPSVVRPSVRPSVVRPSVCKLSHFQLLLQNRLMDFDETW